MTGSPTVRDAFVRAPSQERQAASRTHVVRHSTGLLITDQDPGHDGQFSFEVDEDGVVTELLGWGLAGRTLDVDAWPNPPASAAALHNVHVPGLCDATDDEVAAVLGGLRALIEDHLERYHECQVIGAPTLDRRVANWIAGGCVPTKRAPTNEELAAAARTSVPTAESHFLDTSRPTGIPVSREAAEAEARALADELVAQAKRQRRELSSEEVDAFVKRHVEQRVAEAKSARAKAKRTGAKSARAKRTKAQAGGSARSTSRRT